ncbi:DUF3299 domain-containing protein [Thiothrix winogradskyi]|uniref:DUF3299 domain-containing protein n=1 Tax=Thiothrix winogradskyi TaxID=96472 RepID=A0ABY3T3V4_9GAMM|nr:DUF3299 domain-containing protein [Thiothrix winogradskyi]UJS25208.1 DUF3299 domain-containing protein [Thiothrix winogradskyi]
MKTTLLFPLIILSSLLVACGEKNQVETPPALPSNAPAVGTPITAVTQTTTSKPQQDGEYTEIEWENLELPGQGLADIIQKYQPRIDAIPEGDPAEDALLEEMQAELNAAPVNSALNGKKIKIPGFISPLEVDETKGMVKEFLLVPYFGACIHTPPPPLNQTLLVKPLEGKSIGVERMYEPVWVYGTIVTEQIHTDLAEAGYQIKDASVEIYRD